ncbi:MAG: P1 family peptidase [Gemmatimonadaceae bacterium]|nr:P1 family peptidase [Gemmatimonadaceae bacterium]
MRGLVVGLALVPQILLAQATATHSGQPRARELGISALIGGTPGRFDAITDVAGVEVGHATIIRGAAGPLVVGQGPVRTGVTIVHPRGQRADDPVFGAWFTLNGNGEMTGTTWLEEGGILEGPIGITNTNSVGVVRDGILQWQAGTPGIQPWGLPVAAETWDGVLNDINGFHVKPEHVREAITSAHGGAVTEGAVGGGTGMVCLGFKGGIGTASRKLPPEQGGYTVGVLVQCNFGLQRNLMIAGVPVGQEITDLAECRTAAVPPEADADIRAMPRCGAGAPRDDAAEPQEFGSIIAIVATDAPLLPHQLKRIATRVSLGVARTGGYASNGSGDIFLAFSTANASAPMGRDSAQVTMLSNARISPLFQATMQATEEAIVNAMLAAPTMEGANHARVYGLPADRVLAALRKYGRTVR